MTSVAFYGPDDTRACKVAVGIVAAERADPVMHRWFVDQGDIRHDHAVEQEILELLKANGVLSIGMTKNVFGCPHEEGIDYPDGEVCPRCPFWAHRERTVELRGLGGGSLE